MKKFNFTFTRLLFLATLFVAACSTTQEKQKVPAQPANQAEAREFRDADATYKARKYTLAIKKLTAFVQKHPRTDLTDTAMYELGQIYFDQGDYFRASRYFQAVVDSPTESGQYDRALYGAANAQSQLGKFDEALALLARFKVDDKTDRNLAAQVYELSAKLKLQKGNGLGAVQDLLSAGNMKTAPADKQAYLSRAADIVNGNLSQQDLETVVGSGSLQALELPARFRLAQMFYDQKQWDTAKHEFEAITQKFAGTEQATRAQGYINTLDAQQRTDSTTVGVVLPLSGKYAAQGYKTLRGIQMGFGIFDTKSAPSPVKLAIIDSEGNPDVARRGVERLVTEDHVVAIIGDILSKTAQAVATKSQELGVPCIVLAQKQGLNEIGDFVFRNTVTPEMQVRTLVDLAMKRNLKRFAIIYPNDYYGTEYASLFWDYVLLRGGQITAAQSYEPEETDFRDVIQRLVGTYYAEEDRGKELTLRTNDWIKTQQEANPNKAAKIGIGRDKVPKDILPPVADFDAIFIPDGVKAAGQIAHMLNYNDVSKIPLLGTNLWDNSNFVTRGEKLVEGALFVDDFFAQDPSPAMGSFVNSFKSQFNYAPDVFEAQGYDSALLLAQTMKSYDYNLTRLVLRDHLAAGSKAQGATGPIQMSATREVEKSLVPLTVSGGKIVKSETGTGVQQ